MASSKPKQKSVPESDSIWLEIEHVRLHEGGDGHKCKSHVRFKADRGPVAAERGWWPVASEDPQQQFQRILDGIDNQRIVLGKLTAEAGELVCNAIRIQTAGR